MADNTNFSGVEENSAGPFEINPDLGNLTVWVEGTGPFAVTLMPEGGSVYQAPGSENTANQDAPLVLGQIGRCTHFQLGSAPGRVMWSQS